jgi:hypothetical protein
MNGPDDFIAERSDEEFMDLIQNAAEFTDRLPITLYPGKSPQALDEAEEILVQHAERLRIFQRSGSIVRIVTLPSTDVRGGLRRGAGTVLLLPINRVALTETFDRLVAWQKIRRIGQGFEPILVDCPERIAAAYISRVGSWQLPELTGIVSAPIMRPDGSILCRAGYDGATGLFLAEDWPELDGSPTKDDALAAL